MQTPVTRRFGELWGPARRKTAWVAFKVGYSQWIRTHLIREFMAAGLLDKKVDPEHVQRAAIVRDWVMGSPKLVGHRYNRWIGAPEDGLEEVDWPVVVEESDLLESWELWRAIVKIYFRNPHLPKPE